MSKVSEDFCDAVLNETLNVRADEWDGLTVLLVDRTSACGAV